MNPPPPGPPSSGPSPEPGTLAPVRHLPWPSLVWLVPAVAALIGLSMLVHAWRAEGPELTITFQAATGLEAGKTPVKYKDVTVGTVSAIAMSPDDSHVVATVALEKSAENLARADTRFWVVRPRFGIGGVSGIDTLVSGTYIGVDKGISSQPGRAFQGLENPPTVLHGAPGRNFVLRADDLGSLDIGSPVYYRRIQVGRIASYQLEPDGRHVTLQVFVDAPYDRFVTTGTRFWNASGVDVSLAADGLKLNTQSLATIVAGGVAFASVPGASTQPAPPQAVYDLAHDQQTALAPPDGLSIPIQLRFEQPLRGLATGASVEFAGVKVGQVTSIQLDYDPDRHRFPSLVGLEVYPGRLGAIAAKLPRLNDDPDQAIAFLSTLVEHGLRAQARTGNLLTGQLYIEFAFMPNAPAVKFDPDTRPLAVPTAGGDFDRMQEQVGNIIAKIDRLPLASIGHHLDSGLAELDRTLKQVNEQTLPQTASTLKQAQDTLGSLRNSFGEGAPLQQNLDRTLQDLDGTLRDLDRTARSIRTFTDLLGRHPDSLLKGVPADPAAPSSEPAP